MNKGKATAERNRVNPSMTLNVKTRSPMEAFQMLRLGHPIDKMSAYYDDKGLLTEDFWMLDKTAKLHKLVELRSLEGNLQDKIKFHQDEIMTNQKIIKDEQQKQDNETANTASK